MRRPLVALLFERGAFRASSTEAVAWALAFYALGLVGHAGVEILARAFYALHDTWTPVWVGGLAMGLNILLSLTLTAAFAWMGLPPHGGLALANSVATLLEMGGLLALLRPRLGGLGGRTLALSVGRSLLAAAVMGALLVLWQWVLAGRTVWLVGGGGILVGAAGYLLAATLVRAEEPRGLWQLWGMGRG